MEKLILEALKATEKIRNRDFNNLIKTPLTVRDFETLLEEISTRLNITLEPFDKPNEFNYLKSVNYPIARSSDNLSKISVNILYPQLIYNHYKNSDIPIMVIFKHLFDTRLTTSDEYIRKVLHRVINFFFGYSCGLSKLRYKSPNLRLIVSNFFDNLPDSVVGWNVDILFSNDKEATVKYLSHHNLEFISEDNLYVLFIDKRSYVQFDGVNLIDMSNFKKL
jgi:hypothetical protein